ncbi:hypothetical protein [Ferroplasma sp.]
MAVAQIIYLSVFASNFFTLPVYTCNIVSIPGIVIIGAIPASYNYYID